MDVLKALQKMGEDGWKWKVNNSEIPGCEICINAFKRRFHLLYGYGSTPEDAFKMLQANVQRRKDEISHSD